MTIVNMRYLVVIIILGLMGCGQAPKIDSTFDSALDSIQAEFVKRNVSVLVRSISFQFAGAEVCPPDAIACCLSSKGLILVRGKKDWEQASKDQQKYLLAHEIGHCLLNRAHTEEMVQLESPKYPIPKSIMYPNPIGVADWAKDYNDRYFDELLNI